MTPADAPPVEPLKLPLEEALAKLGERGYTLLVYHRKGAPEYVLCDVYSAFARGSFGHWKDAVEAVLGVTVVPRDDTAELVEALAEPLRYFLEWREEIESDLGIWASKSQTREAFDQAEAALARVRSEP